MLETRSAYVIIVRTMSCGGTYSTVMFMCVCCCWYICATSVRDPNASEPLCASEKNLRRSDGVYGVVYIKTHHTLSDGANTTRTRCKNALCAHTTLSNVYVCTHTGRIYAMRLCARSRNILPMCVRLCTWRARDLCARACVGVSASHRNAKEHMRPCVVSDFPL